MAKILSFKIDQYASGQRLDRYLQQKLRGTGLGYVAIQRLCRNGQIRVNGKRITASHKLSRGEEIKLPAPDYKTANGPKHQKPDAKKPGGKKPGAAPAVITPALRQQWQNAILYEDEAILILNKWSGLAVQGGTGTKIHIDAITRSVYGDDAPKLVHRLDKDTSGVLVLAKTREVAADLAQAFAEQRMEKTYLALVQGNPKRDLGRIDLPLLKKMRFDNEKVEVDVPSGADAVTEYTVLTRQDGFALLELKPLTGRTHQLRVHCAAIGCPIVGDRKYNEQPAAISGAGPRPLLHLHAARLSLPHPQLGLLAFTAPLPDHMQRSLVSLGMTH